MKKKRLVFDAETNPVKNASYWRRKCLRLEEENKVLFNRLKEMEEKSWDG
jgi:hypothetical protein